MRRAIFAVLLALLSTAILLAAAPAKFIFPDRMLGDTPGFLKRYVKVQWVGTETHPFPVVYFSPQKFKPVFVERSAFFSTAEFSKLYDYTRSYGPHVDQSILNELHSGGLRRYMPDFGVAISGADPNRGQFDFIVMRPAACRYFSQVAKLPGLGWTTEKREAVADLIGELHCDGRPFP